MNNKNKDTTPNVKNREKIIVNTSILGIVVNIFLVIFKVLVGLASNSIAIILDAVNNFSDALSSFVTIIGAKLGAKKPDKKHPHGYGRIEYISSMIVAAVILYAGLTSMFESVEKIIYPEELNYGTSSLVIVSISIVVKLILGSYVKKQGKKVKSDALVASGMEGLFDSALSASILASVFIYLFCGISLEAYVALAISIFITKTGLEMMIETLDNIIGKRGDALIIRKIKEALNSEYPVRGAYDVNLFNYGPEKYYGSAHVELPDTMTVKEVDALSRRLQKVVYRETGVVMTGIGLYSHNTTDEEAAKIQKVVQDTILPYDWALQIHGFYADTENKMLSFDVVVSFEIDHHEALKIVQEEIQKLYPDYKLEIIIDIDTDVSDL